MNVLKKIKNGLTKNKNIFKESERKKLPLLIEADYFYNLLQNRHIAQ